MAATGAPSMSWDDLGVHAGFDASQSVVFGGVKYEFTGGVLGSGAFGCVYDAESESGERVAVKVLDTERMSAWAMRQYESECQLWALAGEHEHIVRYLGHQRLGKWMFIFSEPADGGELMDHIALRAQFTEAEAVAIVRQLLSAVERLHSLHIVHRDIKPENVLCVSAPSESAAGAAHPWHIKLCDLGHARVLGEGDLLSTPCGSTGYMAPEVRARGGGGGGEPARAAATLAEGGGYTERADMWSVGCVCHLLLSGAPLAAAAVTAAPPGLTDEVWTRVSTDGRAFVRALLHPDPAARPTATEALQHRWLTVAPSTPLQTPLAVRRARQQAEAAAALLEGGAQAGTWWATRGGGADGSPASADRGSPPAGLPSAAAADDPMDAEMGDGSSGTSSLRCSAEGASLAAAPPPSPSAAMGARSDMSVDGRMSAVGMSRSPTAASVVSAPSQLVSPTQGWGAMGGTALSRDSSAEGEALGGFKRRKCAMWEVGQPRSRSHGPFGGDLPRPSGSNPWATRQASGEMMRQDG